MINFSTVTKSFGDDIFALRDVSFNIAPGELVVITGPSGSGKTTIMRLLTKEYEPTEGEILFEDLPLSEIIRSNVHKLRRQIGVVFQDYKLLPELNVWENIALSLYITGQKQAEIEERVSDLLRLISLDDKPYLFPSQLSGGEAQRVGIARALATAPKVIFADEPTGNLDAETSASIARLLQKINELGTTVLIATHDVSVLDLLQNERHMHLEKGQLISDQKGTGQKAAGSKAAKPAAAAPATSPAEPVEPAPSKKAAVAQTPEPVVDKPKVEPITSVESLDGTDPSAAAESQPKKKFGLPKIWPFGRKKANDDLGADVSAPDSTEKQPEPAMSVESLDETSKPAAPAATTPVQTPKPMKLKPSHTKIAQTANSEKSPKEGETV